MVGGEKNKGGGSAGKGGVEVKSRIWYPGGHSKSAGKKKRGEEKGGNLR